MLQQRERTNALIAKAQAGDRAAMETLLAENAGLVGKLCKFYARQARHCEYEDLMQCGRLGLVRAIEKFNPSNGARFSTYAHTWIRQTMRRALEVDRIIHIPQHVNTPENRHRLGVDLPVCDWSLDVQLGDSENDIPLNTLAAPDDTEAEVIGGCSDWTIATQDAFARCPMPDEWREALTLYFGLDGGEPLLFREIAAVQGIGRVTAQNRVQDAVKKLRRFAKTRGLAS